MGCINQGGNETKTKPQTWGIHLRTMRHATMVRIRGDIELMTQKLTQATGSQIMWLSIHQTSKSTGGQ